MGKFEHDGWGFIVADDFDDWSAVRPGDTVILTRNLWCRHGEPGVMPTDVPGIEAAPAVDIARDVFAHVHAKCARKTHRLLGALTEASGDHRLGGWAAVDPS